MASNESSSSARDSRTPLESRGGGAFVIDLNEVPSSPSSEPPSSPASEACAAVKAFLGLPKPAPGPPADLPSEVRNRSCVCGRTEARGGVVICDGCERWFHLSCANLRSRQAIVLEDWVCVDCQGQDVGTKRWPLGAVCSEPRGTGVRLLDINALPLSDGEGEASDELQIQRMCSTDDKTLSNNAVSASSSCSLRNARNGFDLQGGSGTMDHVVGPSFVEGMHQKLTSNRSFEEADFSSDFKGRFSSGSTSFRRKEPARFSRGNSSTVNQVQLSGCGGVLTSDMEICEPGTCNNARFAEVGTEGNGWESQQLNEGFPIQYGDFFVLHLGEIDMRPSYHISTQIWPVGYQTCWHDKITGSLFTCHVLDGGDSGPVFKVKRYPCSASLIPNGSTILSKMVVVKSDAKDAIESAPAVTSDIGFDEDNPIQMCLSGPDPLGGDLLSCLGSDLSEAHNVQTVHTLPPQNSHPERSASLLHETAGFGDDIGEFIVEGRSSSLVWTKVSETLVDACHEVYKQTGLLRFYCKHELDGEHLDSADTNTEQGFCSLAKFCSLSGPIHIPLVIRGVSEFDTSCEVLRKWLNQDRFGLDVEFVQEIIEQLPGGHACSGYEFLNKRKDYSTTLTVGSDLLTIKKKNEAGGEKYKVLEDLLKGCRTSGKQDSFKSHAMDVRSSPPLGRPLSSTLSAGLASDVLQVWEFLWRFSEILGMKEPLSFKELEKELLNPWFDDSNLLEKIEKEIQENRDLTSPGGDVMRDDISYPVCGTKSVISRENIPKFLKVETVSGREVSLASRTYYRCTGVALTKAHSSLLKLLVGELQAKVASLVDPTVDIGESKSRRGRKKDVDNSVAMKRSKLELLPINELTWPELARRYILAVLSMDGNLDSAEIGSREGGKVFRCLQGDGGVICGSLTGVAGMEADALLLAEAQKQVCGSLKRENDVWPVEEKESDIIGTVEATDASGTCVPEWAQLLEPVRKLPTNVGTRIRKCVYDALDKGPPEWARKILEHSISKEVYKGNASGPTKKAVLSVLANVSGEGPQQKSDKGRKGRRTNTISDPIMKRCRIVLRRAAAADEAKTFCNLLGTTSFNPNDNDDEGILGSPAMASRPSDFRTIDLRLAAGAYGGSHEAFVEDVREVWHNIFTAFGDQSELLQLAETLSQNFESLYETEVLTLVQKYREYVSQGCADSGSKKELIDLLGCANDVPKAPWDEGVCKVCGIDKDDESVLLCDTCDSEYHTYCLVPPLARIPEGNWYCPSCVAGQGKVKDALTCARVLNRRHKRKYQGEDSRVFSEALNHLAFTMREKDYWEFSMEERVFLLKFLCDEALNSAIIREHLDQCADMSSDLQQRLRSLAVELKNLKFKEDVSAAKAPKESMIMLDGVGQAGNDRMSTVLTNHGRWTAQRQTLNNRHAFNTASTGNLLQLDDTPVENKHPYGFYSKGISENGGRKEYTRVVDIENQTRDLFSVTDGVSVVDNIFPSTSSAMQESKHSLLTQPKYFDESSREPNFQSSLGIKFASDTETNGSAMAHEFHGSCLSVGTGHTHLTEHVAVIPMNLDNVFLGHHSNIQADIKDPQAYNLEVNSLKNDILLLQDSIASIELQLLKVSMRRDFLGRDSFGRLYWILSRPGKRPGLVVDGSMGPHIQRKENEIRDTSAESFTSRSSVLASDKKYSVPRGSAASASYENDPHNGLYHGVQSFPSCVYNSDAEIRELIEWLTDSDPRERELKESILHLQRLRSQDTQQVGEDTYNDSEGITSKSCDSEKMLASSSLLTRAATILEKRHGPCIESETIDIPKKRGRKAKVYHEDRMYRCECLERVWPSRQHCFSCHQTFSNNVEFEGHNDGKCNLGPLGPDDCKENDETPKGKSTVRFETALEKCTDGGETVDAFKSEKFDISSRLIKFHKKPMACPYNFEEISKKFITNGSNKELVQEVGLLGSDGIPMLIPSPCPYIDGTSLLLDPAKKVKGSLGVRPTTWEVVASQRNNVMEVSESEVTKLASVDAKDPVSSLSDRCPDLDAVDCDIVPDSSLRPLVGRDSQILRRLKINLLDIDAALPEEALRPTRAYLSKRCSWRAFVKSADSILEMIKAAIVFEDMIQTAFLRNGWWYWSSLSAAARTSTLSSLALRIYTLDASIMYENTSPCLDGNFPIDNLKSGKKRKECEG